MKLNRSSAATLGYKRQELCRDAGLQAKRLASTLLSLPPEQQPSETETEPEPGSSTDYDLRDASNLKGPAARKWFAKQLMLPEWMIDVPNRLPHDWYVLPRPARRRCFRVPWGSVGGDASGSVWFRGVIEIWRVYTKPMPERYLL